MFRFEHPAYLYALLALPLLLLALAWVRQQRRARIGRLGGASLFRRLAPAYAPRRVAFKQGLLFTALLLLIVGWANPQWGLRREKIKIKSVDVMVALDVSQSMLARDVPPSRLERAQKVARQLIQRLKGERIGLILFAGNAYLQMPLTTDYAAALLFLKSANPDMVPAQGTAIGDVIDVAENAFEHNKNYGKALIVITDGETHDRDALDRAAAAADNGMVIFTIGAGTPQGGTIPLPYAGQEDLKRDKEGNLVITRLNEDMLRSLAKNGKGRYVNLSADEQAAETVAAQVEKLEKRETEEHSFTEYESWFPYFLGAALFLLLLEWLLPARADARTAR